VLEAVYLAAQRGSRRAFVSIALRRGEISVSEAPGGQSLPTVFHFFHGRAPEEGNGFHVRGVPSHALKVTLEPADGLDQRVLGAPMPGGIDVAYAIHAECGDEDLSFPVGIEGEAARETRFRHYPLKRDAGVPVVFIPTDSLPRRQMGEMWDRVLTTARESDVVLAMRALEPELRGVFFLITPQDDTAGPAGILLGLNGEGRREPIGSHGEGTRRMLALAIALVQATGGILLVDEIDTGLHYSVMGDMWRMVTEAAMASNVQVFATTHSFDCIRGLAWMCEQYPELGAEVSLQKIVPDLEEAVAFGGQSVIKLVDNGIEVR
jgi:hypothetical protein